MGNNTVLNVTENNKVLFMLHPLMAGARFGRERNAKGKEGAADQHGNSRNRN